MKIILVNGPNDGMTMEIPQQINPIQVPKRRSIPRVSIYPYDVDCVGGIIPETYELRGESFEHDPVRYYHASTP